MQNHHRSSSFQFPGSIHMIEHYAVMVDTPFSTSLWSSNFYTLHDSRIEEKSEAAEAYC